MAAGADICGTLVCSGKSCEHCIALSLISAGRQDMARIHLGIPVDDYLIVLSEVRCIGVIT